MPAQCLLLLTAGLLCLNAFAAPSHAEVVKRVSVDGIYDNNAFKSSDVASDVITRTSFYLARRDTSARTGVEYFYTGDLYVFAQSGQRLFTAQRVGMAYLRQIGQARHLLSAGWNFGGRWDRTAYDYYDDLDGSLYANLKLNLPGTSSLRGGYRLAPRKYLNLDASSFREHLVSLTYNTSLPTRTTLNADVSYGYKAYTMSRQTTIPTANTVQLGRGMRRGLRGWDPFGFGGVGASQEVPIALQSGSPDKSQIALSLRVSQSITPSTGANVQYLLRVNPSSGGRYQSGLGTGYTQDDDLFDDRYDYEGHEITGGISQLLPWGTKLTVETGYLIKDYRSKPALDLNGVSIGNDRSDRRRYLSAGIEMPLGMTSDLNLWYAYAANRSNDPLYNYRGNHVISLGFSREF